MTGLGYHPNETSQQFLHYWPCDLHVIGKDILRFHLIYWPILLMALKIKLPKQFLIHPWILFDKNKMSKSKGNVLYVDDLLKIFPLILFVILFYTKSLMQMMAILLMNC